MVKKGAPQDQKTIRKFNKFDTWASHTATSCPGVPQWCPVLHDALRSQNDAEMIPQYPFPTSSHPASNQSTGHQSLQKRGRRQWAKPLGSAAPCLQHGARRVESIPGSAKSKLAGPAPAAGPPISTYFWSPVPAKNRLQNQSLENLPKVAKRMPNG